MFKRVLVGIDHVDANRNPLWEMAGRLSQGGAEIIVSHITEVHPGRFGAVHVHEGHVEVEKLLADATASIEDNGGKVATSIESRVGAESPAHAITELARTENCDLIVLGTHPHGVWTGALLGSVSQRVAGHSPCPVLLVPCDD